MSPMLDVSDAVRAEIGEAEAARLLAGENAPGSYDCTSCRGPGDTDREPTSTVLFVGEETAVLAFAHASCIPSQVVSVSEEQLQGAVRTITGEQQTPEPAPATAPAHQAVQAPQSQQAQQAQQAQQPQPPHHAGQAQPNPPGPYAAQTEPSAPPQVPHTPFPAQQSREQEPGVPTAAQPTAAQPTEQEYPELNRQPRQAVLGVTCGQVLIDDALHPAIVVEPTGPIARPGSDGPGDDFLPLLIEQGFLPVTDVARLPSTISGWSVLLAMGELHAILQPAHDGGGQPVAWWQAHQPLPVSDGWRSAASGGRSVVVYAAPAGSIGQQPREDLLREALEKAAAGGLLVAGLMPLTGA